MPAIETADLLKTIRFLQTFDHGASPYMAAQLRGGDRPMFYRSSACGYTQSREFSQNGPIYISLSHLQERLKSSYGKVSMTLDRKGGLHISSVSETGGEAEFDIHTVQEKQTGLKVHDTGPHAKDLEPGAFAGIDARPFKTE